MTSAAEVGRERGSGEKEARLEDLVPIAVVIAGGCERCAEKMVERALRQGSTRREIRRTLGIVASLRSLDCFVEGVGAEVVARMERPLEAGRRALKEADFSPEGPSCCG